MRLLLDTHVAIWSVSSSHRLPPAIVELLADAENDVLVSIVTIWEIAIKNAPGRRARMPFSAEVAAARFTELGYDFLGISVDHIVRSEGLPSFHGDPFDRMLVAQALTEPLRLVTHDATLAAYGDTVITF